MVVEVIAYVSIPMWWGTVLLQNEVRYLFFQLGQQPLGQHVEVGAPCNGGLREEERPKHTAVGYGAENVSLRRILFMLQCGTRVFRKSKSQIMPSDFATHVKCGLVSEHKSVLETIHLQLFLSITTPSEYFKNVELVSVANRNLESFPFMLYLHLWNKFITAITAMFSFCTIHSELPCTDTIKKNMKTAMDTRKEVGREVNTEKTKYMLLSH
jgi:hypothetical protein